MDRYAEAGIPWYWEVEIDAYKRIIAQIRAYGLIAIPANQLRVKQVRSVVYVPFGEWEPGDVAIEFPEPFSMYISWEDLAF